MKISVFPKKSHKELWSMIKVIILFAVCCFCCSCRSQSAQKNRIALEKAVELYNSGDKEQARQIFLKLSQKGDFNADYELFYRYINTPEESYKYLRNAAVNGHDKAIDHFLDRTVYRAETFNKSNPKEALKVYKKYLKKTTLKNDKKFNNTLAFLTECAEVPELNAKKFCKKYGLLYNDEDIEQEPYYIWQLAEEASTENGRFGKPEPLLILQLIICGGVVPAEFTSAVKDFYGYYKKGEVHEFKIDDYVTSGYGINFCATRKEEERQAYLKEKVFAVNSKIKKENQNKFTRTVNSFFDFVDVKIWEEEGHDGSGYVAWASESSYSQKEEFLEFIDRLTEDSNIKYDGNINELVLTCNQLKEKLEALIGEKQIQGMAFSITSEGIKAADSLWQLYKTNMTDFVKEQFGSECSQAVERWIYQKRIEDLINIIELYYDYNSYELLIR